MVRLMNLTEKGKKPGRYFFKLQNMYLMLEAASICGAAGLELVVLLPSLLSKTNVE